MTAYHKLCDLKADICFLAVLEPEIQSQGVAGVGPPGGPGGEPAPDFSARFWGQMPVLGARWLVDTGPRLPGPSPCASSDSVSPVLLSFLLSAHPSYERGPTLNPVWAHPEILNLITSTKTLFPHKVTFAATGS